MSRSSRAISQDDRENSPPLFLSDDDIRLRINPKIGRDRFRSILRTLEDRFPDFPRISRVFGGRYWPAVRAWLDDDQGVRKDAASTTAQDGPETFDAPTQRQPRLEVAEDEEGETALLGCETGRPGSDGLPGQNHPPRLRYVR